LLVIDDDSTSRLLLESRLKDQGHTVQVVPNGAQGVLEVRNESYDLVVVAADLSAGIGVVEVCRRLRQIPQIAGTPLVVVSDRVQTREDVHQCFEAGCDAFLAKGEMHELEDVVRALLRQRSQREDLMRQMRSLEDELRRIRDGQRRDADSEITQRESGEQALLLRDLSAGRPDGVLLVDSDGIVRAADRGARDLLGSKLEGCQLGQLAPVSGLEAFVRDARTDPREGLRIDLRAGRSVRSLTASVLPLVPNPAEGKPGLRVVLLLDSAKRRIAAQLLANQRGGMDQRELDILREAARRCHSLAQLPDTTQAALELREAVEEECAGRGPLLLHGERGAGKSFVARVIHYNSSSSGPLIEIDCSSLSPDNLQLELFGSAKGSSGENNNGQPGAIQRAGHGTVLLHAFDAANAQLQNNLLEFLRTREVSRTGSKKPERADARVMLELRSALETAVAEGRLLPEIRASVRAIRVPPLRERRAEIPRLAAAFLAELPGFRPGQSIAPEADAALVRFPWPGNLPELKSCLEKAAAQAEGGTIELEHLPPHVRECEGELPAVELRPPPRPAAAGQVGAVPIQPPGLEHGVIVPHRPGPPNPLADYEYLCLIHTLEQSKGDKREAARRLGIGKSTLYRKLKKHGIE
jgi:DNA-binding NtrC family response regulator